MNSPTMSDEFARAFRAKLIDHVQADVAPRRRRHLFAGVSIALIIGVGGTAAAAATGLLSLPGAPEYSTLGTSKVGTHSGTGSLDLGITPNNATGVQMIFTCLTPGSFTFSDGASVTCATPFEAEYPVTYVMPVEALDDGRLTITTTPDAAWTLRAAYINETMTPFGRNATGQTYGISSGDGSPDLIAVVATNGLLGYVHQSDLADADGSSAREKFASPEDAIKWQEETANVVREIPVFEADGITRIGIFRVGG